MVLKLYKKEDGKILYWEAWPEGDQVLIHYGVLGEGGETTTVNLPEFEPPEAAIQGQAKEARDAGFAEIDHEDLFEVIVQYRLDGKAAVDEEMAGQVEEVLNDCLGWSGLGHCDGSDAGSGSLNVYCYVVDPLLAVQAIVTDLRSADLLDKAVVAYQDKAENFIVLWPEDYVSVFEY